MNYKAFPSYRKGIASENIAKEDLKLSVETLVDYFKLSSFD